MGTMKVVVRYFAGLRDAAGTETEDVIMDEGSTIDDLFSSLIKVHPELEGPAAIALVSVNLEFAERDRKVEDGDEVGIFPPVSGG